MDDVWFKACRTDIESENITNLSFKLHSFMKSKAKSIALASAVKIEEPSGKRNVLQLLFVKVAQPTLFSSFEPSV